MTDFNRVESLLCELTTIVGPRDEIKHHVQHYIHFGEYGLALEWAANGMLDNGRAASPSEMALFREIAQMMHEDPVDQEWYLKQARRYAADPSRSPPSDGP